MFGLHIQFNALNHKITKMMDRRRFVTSLRSSDVFIAAYPKSGTTWLAFLVANVLKPNADETLNLRNFVKYTPDINRLYRGNDSLVEFQGQPDPRFFLVHAAADAALPKVVYVVRDPRDVMVSYWHYQKLVVPNFKQSIADFIQSQLNQPYHWGRHVSGWLDRQNPRRLMFIRYEDMHQDTELVLRQVLDFAGLTYTQKMIDHAVQAGQFSHMQAVDRKFGWEGAVNGRKGHFVRRGVAGAWQDELPESCAWAIEQAYAPVMERFNYKASR